MVKVCGKCKVKKPVSEFCKNKLSKDGLRFKCKSCSKEYDKEYYQANKERKKEFNKEYYKHNKELHKKYYEENKEYIKERRKKYREENKEYIKERGKKYKQANKKKIIKYHKEYYKDNKEKIIEYSKEYYKDNKEKINEYNRNRKKTDALFKLKCNLRGRTTMAFRNKGYSKNTKTQQMLGVEWEVAKQHIERQFTKGMNWNNYGEWHIDHIIPLASAKTPERLKQLCHYTNLQPLWAEENLSKKDIINGQQTLLRI